MGAVTKSLSSKLAKSATIVLISFALANADLCYDYSYVNLGNVFSGGDLLVKVACLDTEGCSVVYVKAGCQGCFDPSCIDGEKRLEAEVRSGKVWTIEGSELSAGPIADGDLMCSTGQLSIVSTKGGNNDFAHEWSRASLAGTKFVHGSIRRSLTTCLIYSFEGSTVTLTAEGVSETSIGIGAYNLSVQGAFLAYDTPITISSSDKPVIVVCSQENGFDYTNVHPVSDRPVYGFNSNTALGYHVNCVSLLSTLPESAPLCEDAFSNNVSAVANSADSMYMILMNSKAHYTGPAMTCRPSGGNCLAMSTAGDGAGFDGTIWVTDSHSAQFFVLPVQVAQLMFIVEASTEKCEIRNALGLVLAEVTFFGDSSRLRYNSIATSGSEGTTISCLGGRATLLAQVNYREMIISGRESVAMWDYGKSISTCVTTHAPTSAPSFRPTRQPRAAPTPMDVPFTSAVVVSSSSLALLCSLAAVLLFTRGIARKKGQELRQARNLLDTMHRPDSPTFELDREALT